MKMLWAMLLLTGIAVRCIAAEQSEIDVWASLLRPQYFGERDIAVGKDIIELRIPSRAEDAGVVPISVNAKIPQTAARYIRTLYIFIDRNPKPLAGRFDLTPAMGKADLAMRLRINQYTDVRVVAETNDGKLYMDSGYTRASGGCSAPPPFLQLKEARKHIGEMKFHAHSAAHDGDVALGQLLISHPNITGMQLDQRTR
ncbi:unnamed protein product, partial [Phaeothamnion confervicola]